MNLISQALRKKIERIIQVRPLERGEFRRIDGMGSHCISLSAEENGKSHFFSFDCGGVTVYLYKETANA